MFSKPLAVAFFCVIALFLSGCGSEPEVAVPTPTLDPIAELGRSVYTDHCAICHATTPDTVIRGPSFYGFASIAGERVAGQDARTYAYNSISRPNDFLVEGFDNVMPTTLTKTLSGEELDAVVAYILTFE